MAKIKIDWTQQNRENFQHVKKAVRRLKRYKNAITRRSPNGQYYVGDVDGNNLMPKQYEDLRLSDTIWGAWKNAFITNHWLQTESRNIKGTHRDIANAVGNTKNIPKNKPKVKKLAEGVIFNHEEWKHDLYEQLMD